MPCIYNHKLPHFMLATIIKSHLYSLSASITSPKRDPLSLWGCCLEHEVVGETHSAIATQPGMAVYWSTKKRLLPLLASGFQNGLAQISDQHQIKVFAATRACAVAARKMIPHMRLRFVQISPLFKQSCQNVCFCPDAGITTNHGSIVAQHTMVKDQRTWDE